LIGLDGREVPNGRDWVPDRLFRWDWKACCDAHDIAYSVGGTDMDRWQAELDFAACLFKVSPALALFMVPVTFLLGYAYYILKAKP